jgi:hypothetical protein
MSLTRKIKLIKKLVNDLEKELDENYFEMHNRKYYLKKGKLFSTSDDSKSVGHITNNGSIVMKTKSKTKSNIKKTNNKSRSIPRIKNETILHASNIGNEREVNTFEANNNINENVTEIPEETFTTPINTTKNDLESNPEFNSTMIENSEKSLNTDFQEMPIESPVSTKDFSNNSPSLNQESIRETFGPNELTTQKVIPSDDADSIRD